MRRDTKYMALQTQPWLIILSSTLRTKSSGARKLDFDKAAFVSWRREAARRRNTKEAPALATGARPGRSCRETTQPGSKRITIHLDDGMMAEQQEMGLAYAQGGDRKSKVSEKPLMTLAAAGIDKSSPIEPLRSAPAQQVRLLRDIASVMTSCIYQGTGHSVLMHS